MNLDVVADDCIMPFGYVSTPSQVKNLDSLTYNISDVGQQVRCRAKRQSDKYLILDGWQRVLACKHLNIQVKLVLE